MASIAIIGASSDRSKFGNKAVRAYREKGFEVFPINPKEKEIEGLKCYKSVLDINKKVDFASLYLPPNIGVKVISEIAKKGIRQIYINPGAESDEIFKECKNLGIKPLLQCSIRAIGKSPDDYL